MTLKLAENRVWVKKVEKKDRFAVLTVSTSRKDKKNDTWVYSNFYVKLVGSSALEELDELLEKYEDGGAKFDDSGLLKKGFPINLKSVTLSNEPYKKDDKMIYNNMQLVCWAWDWVEGGKPSKSDDDEDDNPFE